MAVSDHLHSLQRGLRLPLRRELCHSLIGVAAIAAGGVVGVSGAAATVAPLGAVLVGSLLVAGVVRPGLLVAGALLLCATTGGLSSVMLAEDLPFSLSGALNGLLMVSSGTCLLLHLRDIKASWATSFGLFFLLVGWAAIRAVGSPDQVAAAKDTGLLMVPLVLALVTSLAVRGRRQRSGGVERVLLILSAIPILGLAAGFLIGYVNTTALGFTSLFGTRTLALFLVIVLSLSLAWWKLGSSREERVWGLTWSLMVFGILAISLSRVATTIGAGLLALTLFQPRRASSWVLVAGVVVLLFVLLFQIPQFRARFFFGGEGELLDLLNPEKLNTMGRSYLWPIVWEHSMASPIWGNGTGSARVLTLSVSRLEHPHNDYLRVFHDLGLVGLVLFVSAWAGRIRHHWRLWLRLRPVQPNIAKRHMAACLSAIAVAASFVTDNTLVYSFVTIPVFTLFVLADSSPPDCQEESGTEMPRSDGPR